MNEGGVEETNRSCSTIIVASRIVFAKINTLTPLDPLVYGLAIIALHRIGLGHYPWGSQTLLLFRTSTMSEGIQQRLVHEYDSAGKLVCTYELHDPAHLSHATTKPAATQVVVSSLVTHCTLDTVNIDVLEVRLFHTIASTST